MTTCGGIKTKGKTATMQISNVAGGAGAYGAIELLNKMGGPEVGDSVDTTVFGNDGPYKARGHTLNSATFTGDGFSDYAHAPNQRMLWDNLETDVETWIQWYYDGVNYRKVRVEISDITFTVTKGGFNGLTFTAASTGQISYGSISE
jgi:hypothetical protein